MIRFLNGQAHAIQPVLYSRAGYIPHPLQQINAVRPVGNFNPNIVSGAHLTHILVPHHDFTLQYNFPRRGGT